MVHTQSAGLPRSATWLAVAFWAIVLLAVLALASFVAFAQAPPAASPPAAQAEQKPEEQAPTLSPQDRQTLANLQSQLAAIAYAMSLLQEKQDALLTQFQRAYQAVQKPGYTLDLQSGRYVKAPEKPPEPKKGESKSPRE